MAEPKELIDFQEKKQSFTKHLINDIPKDFISNVKLEDPTVVEELLTLLKDNLSVEMSTLITTTYMQRHINKVKNIVNAQNSYDIPEVEHKAPQPGVSYNLKKECLVKQIDVLKEKIAEEDSKLESLFEKVKAKRDYINAINKELKRVA